MSFQDELLIIFFFGIGMIVGCKILETEIS